MHVTTRNERVISSRKTALELLLTDHYADCFCPGKTACPAGVDIQGYACPETARKELAASLGISLADIEKARAEKAPWPGNPAAVKALFALKTDTAASATTPVSYASMDTFIKGKLK